MVAIKTSHVFGQKTEREKLYLELSFSLSEAGGEHRWREREGGDTAGEVTEYGSTWEL